MWRLLSMISWAKNIVSVEQAIVALNYCITNQISLEDAFSQMGWFLNQPYNSYTSQSAAGTGSGSNLAAAPSSIWPALPMVMRTLQSTQMQPHSCRRSLLPNFI